MLTIFETPVVCARGQYCHLKIPVLLKFLPRSLQTYMWIVIIACPQDMLHYTVKFLHSLTPSGLPHHTLNLKIGVPVVWLGNLEPPRLCNGTRLLVKNQMSHVIDATILTGCGIGEYVFISRLTLTPIPLGSAQTSIYNKTLFRYVTQQVESTNDLYNRPIFRWAMVFP